MKRQLIVLFALLAMTLPGVADDAPLWMRYPAISPDGSAIVFSYKGDLFRVPSTGGVAVPLTLTDDHEFMPVWSHDSERIAFASDRTGNDDIYVMPAQGGTAVRITFHSSDDYPSDFTPDNRAVLFSSTRLDAPDSRLFPSGRLPELYQVPVGGGRPNQLLTIPAEKARYFDNGRKLVYMDKWGIENEWRKHHRSSATRDIWITDLEAGTFEKLTDFGGEDRDPRISTDGTTLYFLSEREGTFNVFSMPVAGGQATALTAFDTHPVRFLTLAANGTLCFGFRGEIYTLKPGGEPEKVSVKIQADTGDTPDYKTVSRGASEMEVSPNGKEVVFIYRGDVFTASVEAGTTKQVTRTPGPERDVSFSPDGRSVLYAAERGGSWNLYRSDLTRKSEKYIFDATLLEEKPVLESDEDTYMPRFSPDGKEVAYVAERTELRVRKLADGTERVILPLARNFAYTDGSMWYRWSPDGKWFLVQLTNTDRNINDVGLVSASGSGTIHNLTASGFEDTGAGFMAKGDMVVFASNRYGMNSFASTGGSQYDVVALFSTQKALDRFNLTKEELSLLKEQEQEAEKAKKAKAEDKKKDDKKKAEKKIKPIAIDLKGMDERRVRLTPYSAALAGFYVTDDGEKLLTLTRLEKRYDLWVTELREKKTKVLCKLGARRASLVPGPEGKYVFLLADGGISRVDVKSGKQKRISLSGDMMLDREGEREAMFQYVWRQIKNRFYDPQLHDTPWDDMRTEYQRFLPHINNNRDFAELLSEILGELNASHTGGRYYGGGDGDRTAQLGFLFDPTWTGDGLKVATVLEKGPMDRASVQVQPGVILERIDGISLTPDVNHHKLLNRKSDKKVLLSFLDPDTKARWEETVKPVSSVYSSLYRRWVERNREAVEELSDGKLGYIHVRSMSDGSFREIYSEAMGRYSGRKGLVVDTRFNGGGDLVDDLVTFLDGRRYMNFRPPRQGFVGIESHNKWTGPSIVVASEGNYSDAHCFPWAYRELGIGKIVGMPVAGTCTFVWWESLQDPTLVFGIPNMAVENIGGESLENQQLEPDVRVEAKPDEVSAGIDSQLETAVAVLLADLDKQN